jgi:hypothetical protein
MKVFEARLLLIEQKTFTSIAIDGGKWIFTSLQKTETPSRTQFLPTTLALSDKYEIHPRKKETLPLLGFL